MEDPLKEGILKRINTIAIYGEIGSGKTALAYKIIDSLKENKVVYFVKHPKPDLLKKLGYKNMYSLEQMERIEGAVIYADEPQLWTSIYDHKTNSTIAKICSLARQKDIKMIISSSDTRVFTKHNEAYFDVWLIKDVGYDMVKNGSLIKKAIKNVSILDPDGFQLKVDEYVFWSRKLFEYNGKYKFSRPNYFSDEYSKPYRITKETANESANKTAK
jgi:hypothetical protein